MTMYSFVVVVVVVEGGDFFFFFLFGESVRFGFCDWRVGIKSRYNGTTILFIIGDNGNGMKMVTATATATTSAISLLLLLLLLALLVLSSKVFDLVYKFLLIRYHHHHHHHHYRHRHRPLSLILIITDLFFLSFRVATTSMSLIFFFVIVATSLLVLLPCLFSCLCLDYRTITTVVNYCRLFLLSYLLIRNDWHVLVFNLKPWRQRSIVTQDNTLMKK